MRITVCIGLVAVSKHYPVHRNILRLSENAKHLSLISADPSALEAVSRTILTEGNPESLRSRDEHRTEPPDAG